MRGGGRVLVRLPSWVGDLVQAEPAVRALAEHLGEPLDAEGRSAAGEGDGGRLTLAGPEHLLPLLEGRFPAARRLPHAGRGGERPAAWRGHDAALLLTGSFRSAWTAWRAGIPRRVGWSRDGRAPLLTDRMRPALERGGTPFGIGRAGRGRRFLPRPFTAACVELVGVLGVSVRDTRPRLVPTEAARARVERRLAEIGVEPGGAFLAANVGARPGSAKGLPAGLWSELIERLVHRTGLPVLLACGPGEEERVRAVRPVDGALALVDPPLDLGELAALCARARVVLTGDTGPRHVAAAVGAAVVSVLGPTDPRHGADHLTRQRIVRREVPCGPCHREACPIEGGGELACLREIDPAEVVRRTEELLRMRTQ